MNTPTTSLQQRLESGKTVLLAEILPPAGADPAAVRTAAKKYAGKVHAVGITDNRDQVAMSAVATAVGVAAEGVEPILHVTTRDRNRIALISEALGAQSLGIRNVLCTSGTHQTLGLFRAAKNVYDIDAVQLLQAYSRLADQGALVGGSGWAGAGQFCLGAVASPEAEPRELQIRRLAKKKQAGAKFLVTQPVFAVEHFTAWWQEITRRGLHEQIAFIAGIHPLTNGHLAAAQAKGKTQSKIPEAVTARLAAKTDPAARRATAIEIAVEIIGQLKKLAGLRGFSVSGEGDDDAALEVLQKSGLGSN